MAYYNLGVIFLGYDKSVITKVIGEIVNCYSEVQLGRKRELVYKL